MTAVREMLRTHPQSTTQDALTRCIDACFECMETCTSCADACLAEPQVADLRQCIALNLACADICETTGKAMLRRLGAPTSLRIETLRLCEEACRLCAEECEKHASMHEHCRICAQACRSCQEACSALIREWQR